MVQIDEATVAACLTPSAARAVVRDTLLAATRDRAFGPVRAVVAAPDGWYGAMPAFVDTGAIQALGAKLVAAFPQNAARGLQTHQAVILLADPQTGTALALVGGDEITKRRTAAVSLVATEALAAVPRGAYAILGSGEQARAHLEAFAAAGLIESLTVWSRTPARGADLVARAAALGLESAVAATADAAVRNADVVVTATAATQPLFAASSVASHAHVNAVGACVPARRELPGDLVARASFYVDSREGALREAGDLLLAMPEHGLDETHIRGELAAVVAGSDPPDRRNRPTIFESLGLGIFDVACAAYVYGRVARGAAAG